MSEQFEWKSYFPSEIKSRGLTYFISQKVFGITQDRPGDINAMVMGSGRNIYRTGVFIDLDTHEFIDASCSCPYAEEGNYCKHEAALLYWIDSRLTLGDSLADIGKNSVAKKGSKTVSKKQTVKSVGKKQSILEEKKNKEKELIERYGEPDDIEGLYFSSEGYLRYKGDEKDYSQLTGEDYYSSYNYFDIEKILSSVNIDRLTFAKAKKLIAMDTIDIGDIKSYVQSTWMINRLYYSSSNDAQNEHLGEAVISCEGRVRSSWYGNICSFFISSDKVFDFSCYEETRTVRSDQKKPVLCEHVTALLLAVIKVINKNPDMFDNTSNEAFALIESVNQSSKYNSLSSDEAKKGLKKSVDEINLVPTIEFFEESGVIAMTLTVGTKRQYKVKSINELLDAIEESKDMQFGSKTVLNLSMNAFEERSRKLVDFLKTAREDDRFTYGAERALADYENVMSDKGFISIGRDESAMALSGRRLDSFFDIYLGTEVKCKDHAPLHFEEGSVRPACTISAEKKGGRFEGIRLSGKMPLLWHGLSHNYFIKDEKAFVRDESGDVNAYGPIERILNNGSFDLRVGVKRLTSFWQETLPWFTENTKLSIENEEEIEKYLLPSLKLSFWFDRDMEKGRVTCKAFAAYGSYRNNLITAGNLHSSRTLTDASKEDKALSILNEYLPNVDIGEGVYYSKEYDKDEEEKIFELLNEGLLSFLELGEVHYTDEFLDVKVRRNHHLTVGVSMDSGLLDISVTDSDLTPAELLDLIMSYRQKKKYFRLKNGDFVPTDTEDIEELSKMVDDLHLNIRDFVKGKMKLPVYRALYVDKLLEENSEIYENRDPHFKKLISEFRTSKDSDFPLPNELSIRPRRYQKDGFRWLMTLKKYGFGGILADEMGLGKTLQTITMILSEKAAGAKKPVLVIVPSSLVYNWGDELKKYAPSLKYTLLTGSSEERRDAIVDIGSENESDVYVTSYDTLKRDIDAYDDVEFSTEVIDEAQYIKTHSSLAAKSVKLIHADVRFALTGTPVENRLSELWSIFDYLMPGFLFSYDNFRKSLEIPIMKHDDKDTMSRLRRMVSPFILRRLKKEVLKDLPEKIEETRKVHMEPEQRRVYDGEVVKIRTLIDSQSEEEFSQKKIEILAELTHIRQICCDPALYLDKYSGGSAKLEAAIELVHSVIEGGHRCLIFSSFTTMLSVIEERLIKEGISFFKITGQTPKKERLDQVNAFNAEGCNVPVFLISLKAGGTGLNLTGADIVIHYDPWWNRAAENQATDRTHRIGQKNIVTVYRLICENTIEEKIQKMQEKKALLADEILSAEGVSSSTLSKEDLMALLDTAIDNN